MSVKGENARLAASKPSVVAKTTGNFESTT